VLESSLFVPDDFYPTVLRHESVDWEEDPIGTGPQMFHRTCDSSIHTYSLGYISLLLQYVYSIASFSYICISP